MIKFVLPVFVAACGVAPASQAGGGAALTVGDGSATGKLEVAVTRPWTRQWFAEGDWYLTGYWEVSLGHWDSDAPGGQRILDLGVAPVFRLQSKTQGGWRPYLEGAIGLHLLSHTHVNANRDLGGAFQFGDHLGVGLILGERRQFDVGYRFQHVSNADVKDPNSGMDFHELRLAYLF